MKQCVQKLAHIYSHASHGTTFVKIDQAVCGLTAFERNGARNIPFDSCPASTRLNRCP